LSCSRSGLKILGQAEARMIEVQWSCVSRRVGFRSSRGQGRKQESWGGRSREFRSGVGWGIIPAGSSIFSVNMRGECVPFGQGSVRQAHHTQQEVALSLGVPARCHDDVDVESN
jgi:hypothetical protein